MAIDPHVPHVPHVRGTEEPSTYWARFRTLVTVAAFVVGGASLLVVGVIPSKLTRASAGETAQASQKRTRLQVGLTGECGIDEPAPAAEGTAETPAQASCGGAVAASADDDRVELDAVGQCDADIAVGALHDQHVPAQLLLTARW